jgi:hypothetical protein
MASADTRRALIDSFLSLQGRALSEELTEALAGAVGGKAPLFLRMILDTLQKSSVHAHLAADVRRLASRDLQSLFGEILHGIEHSGWHHNPGLLTELAAVVPLGMLALVPTGLSVEEMTETVADFYRVTLQDVREPGLDLVRDLVEGVLLRLRPYLIRVEGRFALRHRALWKVAARRYVLGIGDIGAPLRMPLESWHAVLADHFASQRNWLAQGPRSRRLARWHAFLSCDPGLVELLLTDLAYLTACPVEPPR